MISNETPNQRFRNAVGSKDALGALTALNSEGFIFENLGRLVLRSACGLGNIALVKRLLESDVVRAAIAADENGTLKLAAREGTLAVVDCLLAIDAVKANAAAGNNEALYWAAHNGYLDVVNRLLEIDAVRTDAAIDGNAALRWAAYNGHLAVVNRLLEIDSVKDAAAAEENWALRWAAQSGRLEIVWRLLLIDSVRENATANDNEALRSAIHNEHHAVAARLRQIPAVAAHEREHPILLSYYGAAHGAGHSLAALAAAKEGAIAARPVEVKDSLADLKKRYAAQFKERGREAILDNLRKYLVAEYLKKPAQYQGKNLPLLYDKSLAREAMPQYYTNIYHTAWRYMFCQPNPWIAPDAVWVARTPQGASARISEEALETIAYLWLAASDPKEKRPEGIQDRLIEMLCDAARGHNIDKYQKIGQTKDDGEGDNPSCSLGIEGRVSQFLMLLDPQNYPLTPNILCDKFKALVIAENQGKSPFDKINALNLEQLEQLSKAMVKAMVDSDDLSDKEKEILKPIFTIDPSLEKAFFAQCHQEHGACFKEDKPRSFVFNGENFKNYQELAQHLFKKVLDVFYNPLKEKVDGRIKALKPAAPLIPVPAQPAQNVEGDVGAEEAQADEVKSLHARREQEGRLRDQQNAEAARQYDSAVVRQQIENGKSEDGNQEVKEKHAQREALQQKLNVITQAIPILGNKKAALQEEIQNWKNLVKGEKALEPVLIEKQGELKAMEAKLQRLRAAQEAYNNQIKKLTPDPLENFRQVCDKLIALDKEINVLKGSIEKLPKGTDKESSTLQLLSVRQAEMSRLSEEYLRQKALIKGGTKPVKTS